MTTFCFSSNGALASGLVARDEILTGTTQSSKPCMICMSRRFSILQRIARIALRTCINCSAIYCGMRGRISFLIADATQLIVSEHAGITIESTINPGVTEDKTITQVKAPPMSWKGPGPPVDASDVLASNPSHFLGSQRPSDQEQGDGRLDDARRLARENEEFLSSHTLHNMSKSRAPSPSPGKAFRSRMGIVMRRSSSAISFRPGTPSRSSTESLRLSAL